MKISYCITACNEHLELDRLLRFLKANIRKEDEVIIQLDINLRYVIYLLALTIKKIYQILLKTVNIIYLH